MNKNEEILQLIEELNRASFAYYNSDSPIMTDEEFDYKIQKLQNLEKNTNINYPNSPNLNIGAPVLDKLTKIRITPKPMLSLKKCHSPQEIKSFCNDYDIFASLKCDGLSVRLKYQDGILISANTRGDGVIGVNITEHIKQFYNTPTVIRMPGEYIIDGEAVIKYSDFKIVNKDNNFKNPRNAAAGALALLDMTKVHKRRLSFIAWDVIQGGSFISKVKNLEEAMTLGFEIVPYCTPHLKHDNIDEINNFIRNLNIDIPNDGVVWKFDNILYENSLDTTAKTYKSGIAWKPKVEIVKSKLKHIDWTMGRLNILTPVAVFEPVELDGSTVERASLHNLSIMKKVLKTPRVGQKLDIYKANLIIPQILNAEDAEVGKPIPIPQVCPFCGAETAVSKSEDGIEVLKCTNKECLGVLINRLDHFCGKKGLDIKGLSKATLEKLIEWEWVKDIPDIYTLWERREEWINKPGFGEKSVKNILKAIEDSKENVELANYISAIGIPLIGLNVAKEICKHVSSYGEFRKLVDEKFKFYEWDTFGVEKYYSLLKFDYTDADLMAIIIRFKEPEAKKKNNSLEDLTICITGKLSSYPNRAALQKDIEDRGGKVSSSVSGKTNYLINNDKTSTSAKNLSAQKLGIPILTEQEFLEKFLF